MLRYVIAVLLWLSLSQGLANSAEFKVINEVKTGSWSAVLYNNIRGNRLFCSLESNDNGTIFRLNKYLGDNGDEFLEIFNPQWKLGDGDAYFTLMFGKNASSAGIEYKKVPLKLKGQQWADSYTRDFVGNHDMSEIMAHMKIADSFDVTGPDERKLASFRLDGVEDAIGNFFDCVISAGIKTNISNKNSFKLSEDDIGPAEIRRYANDYMGALSRAGMNDKSIANQLASSLIWLEKLSLACPAYFYINMRELKLHYKLYQGTWQLMYGSGRSATEALNRASVKRNDEFNNARSKQKWCEDTKAFVVRYLGWSDLFDK